MRTGLSSPYTRDKDCLRLIRIAFGQGEAVAGGPTSYLLSLFGLRCYETVDIEAQEQKHGSEGVL